MQKSKQRKLHTDYLQGWNEMSDMTRNEMSDLGSGQRMEEFTDYSKEF